MADEFNAYNEISKEMKRQIINHQEQYANGEKHTNINNYRDMDKVFDKFVSESMQVFA